MHQESENGLKSRMAVALQFIVQIDKQLEGDSSH